AQTIVDGELRRDLPLVLREEAGVAMVQIDRVILRIHIGVCPRGRNSRRQTSGRDGPGSNRRPQKTIGTPFRRPSFGFGPVLLPEKNGGAAVGHGPSAGFSGTTAVWFTNLAKSTRQLNPGAMMRMGVNPGQITKFQM